MNKKMWGMLVVVILSHSLSAWAGPLLTRVEGDVTVIRKGQTLAAAEAMPLEKWDKVQTAQGSTADFGWAEKKAGVRVLPQSSVVIENDASDAMKIEIELGNILANLKKKLKGASFEVSAPEVVMAVRGTQFWGRVEGASVGKAAAFAVRKGRIEAWIRKSGERILLKKGEALEVFTDSARQTVKRPALPAELEALKNAETISI